jgi:hypothetical protein
MVDKRIERAKALRDLVFVIDHTYFYLVASEDLHLKLRHFEVTAEKILTQTIECSIIIRELTGHGFTCAWQVVCLTPRPLVFTPITQSIVSVQPMIIHRKISDLINRLQALQLAFDSGGSLESDLLSVPRLDYVDLQGKLESPVVKYFDLIPVM